MRMKYWMLALASTFLLSFQAVAANVANLGNTEATSLPKATVTRLDAMTLMAGNYTIYNGSLSTASENLRLQAVVNFKAEETVEQAQAGGYGDYACDFYLSFSGLKNGSIDGSGSYLAGCYGESGAFSSLGWIAIPTDIFADSTGVFTITENVEYPVLSAYDANLTYENICDYVKDFTAAIYVKPEILEANPDFKVSLALKMREPNTNTLLTVGDAYVFDATTLKKAFLPTATVTTVKNDDLTFALNFKADAATEAQLATYGNWYADFVLKVNKDVTFNANGGANGYLSGQYDAWSENWVNVPFEDVTLKANESLKIMEYAAEMMNQSGLKLTYNDVYSFVKDFDCGVFFEPAFLAANPDLNVTLELRMYNPANEDESYVIGKTYEFKVGEKPTVVIPETITPPEGIEGNTTVETTVVVLPTEVKTFEISLKTVETESSVTSKVVFTVEPKNETGDKVSEPTSAITFRLPVPTTWAGFAKVSHDGKAMGVYEIKEANGDKYVEVSSATFSEFAVELAAVELPGEDDKAASEAFGANTVFDGTNYYATLQAAVEAVCGTNGATLYCKPGADVGSLQHAPVTATLTIYGNGAYVSGGSERDFDIGNTDPSGGKDITADMTLTVKDLDGCGAWGAKATDHTVNLIFEDCQNMGKVLITGTTGTLNITIKDSAFEGVIKEAVYSNADGAITLTNVDFSNLNKAVNLNHKAAGTQTVTITDCSFTACGADVANDQIPVRVLSSVEGGKSELTVSGTTFTGTPEGGADILLDYGVGETTANISTAATVANVVVEKTENVGTTTTIPANTQNQSFATVEPVAKIGETTYATFAEALTAAKAMTGDVTVEIYEKVTLNTSLSGSYSSITFVGKDTDAEIYLEVQGYITATGKTVNFQDLTLSKSQGGFITNAGFMNTAFGVYDVKAVNYTNCTFSNGAYASSGTVTFTKCIFKRSWDKYGLWAYGDVNCIVDECTFDDYRGIKMYAEGAAKTTDLTVKNSDFSAVTDKPAIVLTYGESVNLEDNTYSSTGTFELDLDGAPNGVAVTSDVTPTCKNDNGACGVLVDGKIYTTVAQAAAVATSGSTVTLLHDSTESVELAEGVTLNKNGFTADGVTVAQPVVAKIGETPYATLQAALDVAMAGDTIVLLADVTCTEKPVFSKGGIVNVDVNGHVFVSTEQARVRNVASADGVVPSNNIKFVSGFGWEVYSPNTAEGVNFRVFPTLDAVIAYEPAKPNPARIYPYEDVKQEKDVVLRKYGHGTSSTICIDPEYDITWDLNGYTVLQESPTGNPLEACIRGKFTLKDSSAEQTGKWIAGACGVTNPASGWYGNGGPALYVLGEGEAVLEGGTISIARNATLDTAGNEVVNSGGLIRVDGGKLNVNGATLQVDDTYGVMAWGGEIEINAGTFDIDPAVSAPVYAVGYYEDVAVEVNSTFAGALCVYGNVAGYKGASATVNVAGVEYATGGDWVVPSVGEGLMTFNGLVLEEGVAVVTNATSVTPYATLADAVAAAQAGDTITLLTNVEISDSILLDKSLTLDLGGNTITSSNNRSIKINTSDNAAEEIVIKNGTVVSTPDGGRCIQLGGDSLKKLELDGVTLKAENGQYTQTITLAETNSTEPLEFVVKNSTVVASDNNGYAVIFFCPVDVTIEESTMSGFAALYFKNFGAANDSSGSEVSIKDSHLIGTNVQGGNNTFGTISTEADNIAITVSGGSITAQKTNASIQTIVYCGWPNDESTGLNASFDTELILGEGCRILDEFEDLSVQTVSVRAEYAQALKDAGYAVQPVEGATGMIQISDAVAKIGDNSYYATLADAIAAAQSGETITLLADVTASEIIVLDKAITLDGNGKKLTSTAARAINVSGTDGVTIKNLTINASGERAINIIQNATNVTIDNVTATAANYTVNVASSAPEAVVTITNSNLTGLNVVNVAAEGAMVTITGGKLTCNDQNAGESYSALALNKDAKNGTITATSVTFDIKGDSKKALNGAEGGTITIDGSTDEVSIVVAYISYGDNYYSFTSLQDAIDYAQAGQDVTLLVPPTADANNVVTARTAGTTLEAVQAYEVAKLLGGEFKKTTEGTLQYAYEFGVSYITYDPTNAEKPIVLVAALEEGEDAAANRNLTGRFLVVTVTQKSNGASTKYMVQDPVLDADGKITVNLPLVDDQSGQGVLFSVGVTDEAPASATAL